MGGATLDFNIIRLISSFVDCGSSILRGAVKESYLSEVHISDMFGVRIGDRGDISVMLTGPGSTMANVDSFLAALFYDFVTHFFFFDKRQP